MSRKPALDRNAARTRAGPAKAKGPGAPGSGGGCRRKLRRGRRVRRVMKMFSAGVRQHTNAIGQPASAPAGRWRRRRAAPLRPTACPSGQARLARAAADIDNALTCRGSESFHRLRTMSPQLGVQLLLQGGPGLACVGVPIGDLVGIVGFRHGPVPRCSHAAIAPMITA
jgi:hypothetical protein